MQVDRKALHILFNTVWDQDAEDQNWIEYSSFPEDEIRYAESAGVMKPTVSLTHRSIVARVIAARNGIERAAVATAFANSLSTRCLHARSTLGSFAHALHLTQHTFAKRSDSLYCGQCGSMKNNSIDYNQNLFRKIMFSGNVLQGDLSYMLTDLESFRTDALQLNGDGIAKLRELLDALRALPESATLGDLQGSIVGIFPSSKAERQVVLEILGYCGILRPRSFPSMHKQWLSHDQMPTPAHFYSKEWMSPISCWQGADGVDEEAVSFWFGSL